MKWMLGAQSVLLVLALAGIGLLNSKVNRLEHRLDEATKINPGPTRSVKLAKSGKRPPPRHVQPILSTTNTPPDQVPTEAKIDDHLWSDEGRAVIDDVVQERDEARHQKRAERFKKMGEIARERRVAELVEEFDLDESQEAKLSEVLRVAGEAMHEIRRKMRHDEDVDPEALMNQREDVRAELKTQLTEVLGEEGADSTLSKLRGPF